MQELTIPTQKDCDALRSKFVTLEKKGRGEHSKYMLSSVLKSKIAIDEIIKDA